MRIDVTQEDIDAGIPKRCRFCPVARAISRATGANAFAWFDWFEIETDARAKGKLPVEATNFIEAFDAGRPVSPFSFEIPE